MSIMGTISLFIQGAVKWPQNRGDNQRETENGEKAIKESLEALDRLDRNLVNSQLLDNKTKGKGVLYGEIC